LRVGLLSLRGSGQKPGGGGERSPMELRECSSLRKGPIMDENPKHQGRKRIVEKKDGEGKPSLRKVAFLLDPDTDLRLTLYARKKRLERCHVVEQALRAHLRGIRISFPSEEASEGEATA
jgi:hypothetical protein